MFEGMGRHFGAGLLGAALLLLPAAPSSTFAADGGGADLGLLRQFHSYAPARHLSPVRGKAQQAKRRAALMRKARAAWRGGDYVLARKLFRRAFRAGEITAGWYLGYLHSTGRSGRVDHEKAFRYYRALAKRYDPDERDLRRLVLSVDALVRVADYYRTGIGPKKKRRDLRRAFRLYSMAAAHNHAGAFYGMALVALASDGRVARKRWVVGWLKRAAMAGHAPAAAELSKLATRGMPGILKPDPVAAEAWRLIALRLRGPKVFGRNGADVAVAELAPEQRAHAVRLAEQFLAAFQRARAAAMPPATATTAAPSVTTRPAASHAPVPLTPTPGR
jgi:tetratricopeptide (TPR) repeat protein